MKSEIEYFTMPQTAPKESSSITSSILRKQDCFWENILCQYEKNIENLKAEENAMQNYIFELKVLIQAVSTFNLIKLLNQNNDANLINQLLHLPCICATSVPKAKALKVNLTSFDLNRNDIQSMAKLKELVRREQTLIDEVNMLRIKDATLAEMKENINNLMKLNFPNMVFSAGSGKISDVPVKITELLKEVRRLNDELSNIEKENGSIQYKINVTIPNKFLKLRRCSNVIEKRLDKKRLELANLLSKDHINVLKDIIHKHHQTVKEMRKLVLLKEDDVEYLKQSIELMKLLS